MNSIDTYLCKEKKEVCKINLQPVIVNYAIMTRAAVDESNRQQALANKYNRKNNITDPWWKFW